LIGLELVRSFGVVREVGPPLLGRRRFGVPIGGAFDSESARLARALLGLSEAEPVWELGLAFAEFRVLTTGSLAVVGAPCRTLVDGVAFQGAFAVEAGASVVVEPPALGSRVYVGFRPGIQVSSRRLAEVPASLSGDKLRVVAGSQGSAFDLEQFAQLEFRVGMASDRVGIRCEGVFQPHELELPSEAACVGTIQVTRSGELLILGPDGPTIGGYPKVAVVASAEVSRLGQLRPGQTVSFKVITVEAARAMQLVEQRRLDRLVAQLSISA